MASAAIAICSIAFVTLRASSGAAGKDAIPPLACVDSSYSVSSEIMNIKNASSVEGMKNGAAATDQPACSRVGVEILKDGGNAADAAVASAFCLGVVNPASSGIGGGAFVLVRSNDGGGEGDGGPSPQFEDARVESDSATAGVEIDAPKQGRGKTEFIDCRETAPLRSSYDMFEQDPKLSTLGGMAIAVPGELRGLELLHARHGSLPWKDLVRPAMELARDGFPVGTYLAGEIKSAKKLFDSMPNLGYMLTKNNDGITPLVEGDIMVRAEYAKTLEAIMDDGADAFFQGKLAELLAKDIQDAGGKITTEDLTNYRPVLRDPLIAKVSGYTVVGSPPPSSGGGAIIGALRFLSGFASPYAALADTLSKHHYVEACRHVFAVRMSLSDPGFAPEENEEAVKDLIDGTYIESLRAMTSDDAVLKLSQYGGRKWAKLNDGEGGGALEDAQEGDRRIRQRRKTRLLNYLEDHGTTSLSIIDKDRNAVSITSSVNLAFGSKVVSPSTGVVLNNQMDDFSSPGRANYFGLRPSKSNYASPGKRPLSSMSPTMVFRADDSRGPGGLLLCLGASGGPKIITAVLQTVLNHLFVGMPLYESVSAPRVHDQLLYHGAAATNVERDTLPQGPRIRCPERTLAALEKRGHKLIDTNFLGTVQAVAVDAETRSLAAVSDVRKQGRPAGY